MLRAWEGSAHTPILDSTPLLVPLLHNKVWLLARQVRYPCTYMYMHMLSTDSVPSLESPSEDTFSILGRSVFVRGLVFLQSVRLPCFHPGFHCRASTPGDFHTFLLIPCSPLGVWTPMGFVPPTVKPRLGIDSFSVQV